MMVHSANFEHDAVGRPPRGWTATCTGTGEPRWSVEAEPTAPTRAKIVKQSGTATFPVLLKDGTAIRDGYIEVAFMAVAGARDRAAGVIWRAKDANNYYVARANALEDNVVLYKTVNGKRSALDIVGRSGGYGVAASVPSSRWLKLHVDFNRSRFAVAYEGKLLFEVEDSTFSDPGMIGLWTKADSVTLFDRLIYAETR